MTVSVALASFDGGRFIREQLESIAAQAKAATDSGTTSGRRMAAPQRPLRRTSLRASSVRTNATRWRIPADSRSITRSMPPRYGL